MANHNQNGGRNVAVPDESQPSWRPQDEPIAHEFRRRGEDDRAWPDRRYAEEDYRHRAPRYGEDRLHELRPARRDDAVSAGSFEDRYRDHDDRSGRYWLDRAEPERHASHGSYRGRDFGPERRGLSRGYEERMGYPTGSYGRSDERIGYPAGSYTRHPTPNEVARRDAGESHVHRGTGPHRGKGPAGYQRSDERIRELVCESLTDDDQIDASRIEVAVQSGEVTLTGSVEDRHAKRDAEDCACSVPGVRDVQNLLRVQPDDPRGNRPASAAVGKHETETSAQDRKARA